MKLVRYLGPHDAREVTIGGKTYEFVAPGDKAITAYDKTWDSGERGQPLQVNNDHVMELLTMPDHRFVEVEDQPTEPVAPAPADVAPSAEGKQ